MRPIRGPKSIARRNSIVVTLLRSTGLGGHCLDLGMRALIVRVVPHRVVSIHAVAAKVLAVVRSLLNTLLLIVLDLPVCLLVTLLCPIAPRSIMLRLILVGIYVP